jgi:hypothetical protein
VRAHAYSLTGVCYGTFASNDQVADLGTAESSFRQGKSAGTAAWAPSGVLDNQEDLL